VYVLLSRDAHINLGQLWCSGLGSCFVARSGGPIQRLDL
jgi:hypothetical protein